MAPQLRSIRKRDGRLVAFDPERIAQAVLKATKAVGCEDQEKAENVAKQVASILRTLYKGGRVPTVENVQDLVETILMEDGYANVAKAYILYREQHAKLRQTQQLLSGAVEMVESYLGQEDWRIKENSNMSYSLQGLNNHIFSIITSNYWLNQLYPAQIREAHESGDFHIHDLGLLAAYCCGWDLKDLLTRGFRGVFGKVESLPPKHLRTALGQIVNFFYTLQGETAGAQAFSNFDTLLAPFIYYDGLNYKQVKQAMQEFVFNINVPTRVGFQTPFTNLTMDLVPPKDLGEEAVIVGGKPREAEYKEFQKEMDLLNKAFCEVMMEGDAKERIFTFPIPTYNITKEFDWQNNNLEVLWKMTAKYGVPYFSNFINSDMEPEDTRSMCIEGKEEILIRNSKEIKRASIKGIAEDYKIGGFDKEGWAECKKEGNLEILSLNPQTLKLEWSPVKRFLRIKDTKAIEITTEDGKKAIFSLKHPMAVYTPNGIEMKFAKNVKNEEYLLTLKKANSEILSKNYQKIEDHILNEDLAKILGYFVACGNYLFESRKGYAHFDEPRGLQFSFKTGDLENLNLIKSLIGKVFGMEGKEKQEPRYNTYYLYVYNTVLSRKLYKAGFKKYGRLPQMLFNSPTSIIKGFLDFYLKGNGYEKRKEIHLNDLELSRDLVLLFSLVGQAVTYRLRKGGQRIYLQHAKSKIKRRNGWMNNPILAERVPGWMAISTTKVAGLVKSRMIGLNTLERYNAHTLESLKIKNSDIYLTRVKGIKIKRYKELKQLYDLELEKNHLFIHSLGQISFNCCRLRLDNRELQKRGGGLFGANPLTGSIGVVTLNMPRLGYLSRGEKDFFERLERLMDLSKESLEIKRKVLERFTQEGLYPYSRYYLSVVKERFGSYWKNHFSTIGLNGMNEACLNLLKRDIASSEGKRLAIKTLNFMRDKIRQYQEETGDLYNLEATPAEGAGYRLAKLDRERYPLLIQGSNGNGKLSDYTNSTHLSVDYTDDLFKALSHQDELQVLYTGGTVFHGFLGEKIDDARGCKLLVKRIAQNFHLPYYTLTPTFSICPTHGYISGEQFNCPSCGEKSEVYSRVVGYYRPVQQWNEGKQAEFSKRKVYQT